MTKGRLEAFSDGVLAILITIMVLELHAPEGTDLNALFALWPNLLSYILSFVFLAIYWVNHHHLLHAAKTIDGRVLWANMHLLFWLSLVPVATAWVGQTSFASVPLAVYAVLMLIDGQAYTILVRVLVRVPGQDPNMVARLGNSRKGTISHLLYALAIPTALVFPPAAVVIFVVVGAMWFIPDRQLEVSPGTLAE